MIRVLKLLEKRKKNVKDRPIVKHQAWNAISPKYNDDAQRRPVADTSILSAAVRLPIASQTRLPKHKISIQQPQQQQQQQQQQ